MPMMLFSSIAFMSDLSSSNGPDGRSGVLVGSSVYVVVESSYDFSSSNGPDGRSGVLVDSFRVLTSQSSCNIIVLIALISKIELELLPREAGLCSSELSCPFDSPSKYNRA